MGKIAKLTGGLIRSPWLWGALTTGGFYWLVHEQNLGGEFTLRYFAGHWVLYVTTAMFFLGMAVLILKALDLAIQRKALGSISLGERKPEGEPVENCSLLRSLVGALPMQESYVVRRLRDTIDHVDRTKSGDQLEDELKFLSDADAGRQHAGYAFVRLIITSTPLMGFLGTVIGITMAIAEISPQQLIDSPKSVTAGLAVAFDTTALAIALSLILLVTQYLVDRFESLLLSEVDSLVTRELGGRFAAPTPESNDPQVRIVSLLAEKVLSTTEGLVGKQADLWSETMNAANVRWTSTVEAIEEQLGQALAQALSESLVAHSDRLASVEETSLARLAAAEEASQTRLASIEKTSFERQRDLVRETSQALAKSVDAIRAQQAEIAHQGEILLQVVEATGQVTRLEETLNRNLHALAGAAHFSETMVSLSAALHLLTARLGADADRPSIHLKRAAVEGQAA